jgi:hypothetical protein
MKTKTAFLLFFFLLTAVTWAQTNPVSDFSYDLNAAGDGVVMKNPGASSWVWTRPSNQGLHRYDWFTR